jgi:hypothetical protein
LLNAGFAVSILQKYAGMKTKRLARTEDKTTKNKEGAKNAKTMDSKTMVAKVVKDARDAGTMTCSGSDRDSTSEWKKKKRKISTRVSASSDGQTSI